MTTPQPPAPLSEGKANIDRGLVERLIADQAPPQWAHLPISYLATGWDNEVYRLGEELLVRLPRHAVAEQLGERERRWLGRIAADTGMELIAPLFSGSPTQDYPWSFSIVRYVSGVSAASISRVQRDHYALGFARYLRTFHAAAPLEAPRSDFRGMPLRDLEAATRERMGLLPAADQPAALAIWESGLRANSHQGPARWLHGDPHPHNTIVHAGAGGYELASLVDFGDLCAGDPASDLGMMWLHFTAERREQALAVYGVLPGSDIWLRARAWALRYAMIIAPKGLKDPLGATGVETLSSLLRS